MAKGLKAVKCDLWLQEGYVHHQSSVCVIPFIIPSRAAQILAWSSCPKAAGQLVHGAVMWQWQHRLMRQDVTALLSQLASSVINLNPGQDSAEKLELDGPAAWVVLNKGKDKGWIRRNIPSSGNWREEWHLCDGCWSIPLISCLQPISRSTEQTGRSDSPTGLDISQFEDFLSARKIEFKTRALIWV